jgi:hypothetical protein
VSDDRRVAIINRESIIARERVFIEIDNRKRKFVKHEGNDLFVFGAGEGGGCVSSRSCADWKVMGKRWQDG